MKKVGETQSGTLIVEMPESEFERFTSGAAVPVDAFMTMRMTVKDCVDYCAGKFAKIRPNKKSGVIRTIKAAFNFKADITDVQSEQIYRGLLNKKLFKESDGRIEW